MSNFLQDLERVIGDEEVTAVTYIEPRRETDYGYGAEVRGPYDWADVKSYFDYEYDTGYGSADCHAVYLWTLTRVIFVGEYDGATGIESIPLSPWHSDVVPRFI
ncbi:MAG: hypothetical protein LC687_05750 [Actinobacteria bacterium]|nr:hypothetical protein [Actinomycetota bacterium]